MVTSKLITKNRCLEKFVTPKNTWNPIDEALYTTMSFFNNYEKAQRLILPAVKYSFKHHYENNALYHRVCKVNNITPEMINSINDFSKIPLIPDTFFKDYPDGKGFLNWLKTIYTGSIPNIDFKTDILSHDDVIEGFNKKGINIMFTSGTNGRFSFIPRDNISLNRLKYSAMVSVIELMDYDPTDSAVLLIPDPRKTNLTLASLFGIAYDLYYPANIKVALDIKITTQFIRLQQQLTIGIKDKIKAKAMSKITPIIQKKSDLNMIHLFKQAEKEGLKLNIGTPPFWLDRILEYMKKESIYVNLETSQILTGGGWKIEEEKRLPEEIFRKKVEDTFGIPQQKYRDVYAMSECSSVFLSCEGHYKHIPPIIIPYVLDEELKPVGYKKFGRFAFIDPLPESYPGFIITGDRVRIFEHCPKCDRDGPVLDVEVTRLPGVEGRGCAAVMAELMQNEEK